MFLAEAAHQAAKGSGFVFAVFALMIVAASAVFLVVSPVFRDLWRFFPGGHKGVWVLLALITALSVWIIVG